jgi:AcrR family transcriptional regulator
MSPHLAAERRLQHRAETRRAILDAAEELLVEGGLEAFSMRRLAERCGCRAPTLYHYFRDKHGLVEALLEERLRQLVEELKAVELSDDAARNVRALCAAFAAFGLRNPSHYQLLVMNRGAEAPLPPSGEQARRLLEEPLEELVRCGDLAAEDLEALSQGLWCTLHGFVLLRSTRPDESWVPDLLDRALDAQIRSSLRGGGEGR